VPNESDPVFCGGEASGQTPAFSDLSFQNERALWWAEFDSVGEEAVRGYVERNSYNPTGMEIARQWLARREFLQLRADMQSIKALAEQVQETASESLTRASQAVMLARQVDTDSRAIVEMAVAARKSARIMIFVGVATTLLALCAIVMALASSRQGASSAKQASAQPSHPEQAVVSPVPPVVPRAEEQQTSAIPPESAQDKPLPEAPRIAAPDAAPDAAPEGQSLAATLAQIADRVSGEGAINFTAQFSDMVTGQGHSEQLSYRTSNVTIDPNRCRVGYHFNAERDGLAVSDQDDAIELRLAKSVTVTSIDAGSGTRFSVRTSPQVHVVRIARWDNVSGGDLYFRNRATAARVGAAIRRAVGLCANGEQQFRRR
jgi:hypothetical protein